MQLILACETNIVAEFEELLQSYWTNENSGHEPLAMDWPMYTTLEAAGICRTYTARNGRDKLIGAVMYNVVSHPHHKGYIVAECDIICVEPQYRKLGIGARLMEFAEKYLIADRVQVILHRHKHIYKTTPLFLAQGYEADETIYRKKVG